MVLRALFAVVFLIAAYSLGFALELSEEHQKLGFFVGKWENLYEDPGTGSKLIGKSTFQWTLQGKWLQWYYTHTTGKETLEVITKINYSPERKNYIFLSMNSRSAEFSPSYGNWVNDNLLRMEIKSEEEYVQVDFELVDKDTFVQKHFDVEPSGERSLKFTTVYRRIK